MSQEFVFIDDASQFRAPDALVVRVPRGIRSKEKLFGIYADGLHFPNYFGWNWDALEECLRDLSWLPPAQPIAIVHDELPFGPGGENRAVYFDLLRTVFNYWAATDGRSFQIILPQSAQDDLIPRANGPR